MQSIKSETQSGKVSSVTKPSPNDPANVFIEKKIIYKFMKKLDHHIHGTLVQAGIRLEE